MADVEGYCSKASDCTELGAASEKASDRGCICGCGRRCPGAGGKVSSALQVVMEVKLLWAEASTMVAHAVRARGRCRSLYEAPSRCSLQGRVCAAGAVSRDKADNAVAGAHAECRRWWASPTPRAKRAAVAVACR
jgi:hypothetical protein